MKHRNFSSKFAPLTLALAACLPLGALAQGQSCESLKSTIEDRVRGHGLTNFRIDTVDISEPANGQVVGTCQRGSKRLVMVRGAGQSATSADSPASAAPQSPAKPVAKAAAKPVKDAVITECFDGKVYKDGPCK